MSGVHCANYSRALVHCFGAMKVCKNTLEEQGNWSSIIEIEFFIYCASIVDMCVVLHSQRKRHIVSCNRIRPALNVIISSPSSRFVAVQLEQRISCTMRSDCSKYNDKKEEKKLKLCREKLGENP